MSSLTLLSLLALATTVLASTGTISGAPLPSATSGAFYPLGNTTLPYGTGTGTGLPYTTSAISGDSGNYGSGASPASIIGGGPGGSSNGAGSACPGPVTVTQTTQITVTVTASDNGGSGGGAGVLPTSAAGPPYPISDGGSSGAASGTAPVGSGTGASSGVAVATGGLSKRLEMRGLRERKEMRRGLFGVRY